MREKKRVSDFGPHKHGKVFVVVALDGGISDFLYLSLEDKLPQNRGQVTLQSRRLASCETKMVELVNCDIHWALEALGKSNALKIPSIPSLGRRPRGSLDLGEGVKALFVSQSRI